jgi:hypothetical protein
MWVGSRVWSKRVDLVQNFAGNSTGAWRRVDGRMVLKLWYMEDMVLMISPVLVVR